MKQCWCGLSGIPCFVVPLKHGIMLERDSCCWCGLSGIPRGNPYICYDYNDYICYDRGKARDVDNGDPLHSGPLTPPSWLRWFRWLRPLACFTGSAGSANSATTTSRLHRLRHAGQIRRLHHTPTTPLCGPDSPIPKMVQGMHSISTPPEELKARPQCTNIACHFLDIPGCQHYLVVESNQ